MEPATGGMFRVRGGASCQQHKFIRQAVSAQAKGLGHHVERNEADAMSCMP